MLESLQAGMAGKVNAFGSESEELNAPVSFTPVAFQPSIVVVGDVSQTTNVPVGLVTVEAWTVVPFPHSQ